MTRRSFVAGGTGAAAASALAAACVPGGGAPPASTAGSVLFWGGGAAGLSLQFWNTAESAFRQAFPKIEFKREVPAIPQGGSFDQVLIAAAAAGTGPDVWSGDVTPWRQQAKVELGLPRALDDYYGRFPNMKKVFPWMRRFAVIDGKTYGLPHEVEFIAVFYNKQAMEKGNVRQMPATWDDFMRVGRTLKSAGLQPLSQRNVPNTGHLYSLLLASLVGKDGVDDILYRNGRWDSDGPVQAAQHLLDLMAAEILPRNLPEFPFTLPNDFHTGAVAQWVTGTWTVAGFEDQKKQIPGFDYDYYPLPARRSGLKPQVAGGPGGGFSISTKAKSPEAAATFLDFLYGPVVQRAFIEILFEVPPVPFKPEDYNVPAGARRMLTLIHQFEQSGIGYNLDVVMPGPQHAEYWPLLEKVLRGQASPKEMWTRLQQLWEIEKSKSRGR